MSDNDQMATDTRIQKLKEEAAIAAAAIIEDRSVVGLGSGTTARLLVDALGKRVKEGLRVVGVPTSEKTAKQAEALGISLGTLAEYPRLHVTVDGADEVESDTLNLVKGGRGNLLREKLVAVASDRFIVIIDDQKLVAKLGTRSPLPVEVVPFGWESTKHRLEDLDCEANLRLTPNGEAFITDGGHDILDCSFRTIESPSKLAAVLDRTVGVVEHGLFIGMTSMVMVGQSGGVRRIQP